jgi:ribosomal protein L32
MGRWLGQSYKNNLTYRDTNLTAYYEEALKGWFVPEWLLLAFLFGLALLIGICLISALLYVLWRRRRKRKRQRNTQLNLPTEVGFEKTKTCGACGKQFNGVHTFCPYCFTFHGKDY